MKVGVTGHQKRRGIDWHWVVTAMRAELENLGKVTQAFSSLAAGADQVFAATALDMMIPVTAVIPLAGYEQFFGPGDLATYKKLVSQCSVVRLRRRRTPELSFFAAGRYIVDHSDSIIAIWDGRGGNGVGSTADVVAYALKKGRHIIQIEPIHKGIAVL